LGIVQVLSKPKLTSSPRRAARERNTELGCRKDLNYPQTAVWGILLFLPNFRVVPTSSKVTFKVLFLEVILPPSSFSS
jgi:hypothetical protein